MTRLLADGKRLTLWAGSALAALVEKPAATKIICARLQQPLVAGGEYAFRALHRLNPGPTYMSYGKDERHFDKHIWQLPIPKFDPSNPMHNELARLCKTLHSHTRLMPPTLPHAQSCWRTTGHQIFLVPRIKFIDRIQNSLPDLDVSWSYSHRSPVP